VNPGFCGIGESVIRQRHRGRIVIGPLMLKTGAYTGTRDGVCPGQRLQWNVFLKKKVILIAETG
jgi:hypothetical protein